MLRCCEPGLVRIGRYCPSERRAMWIRSTGDTIELCAGREGDDAYVSFKKGQPLPTNEVAKLIDMLEYAVYAVDIIEGRPF